MKNTLLLIGGLLLVGGLVTSLVGHFWEKTAELLSFFGRETNPEAGWSILKAGLAVALIGALLLYVSK